MFIGHYAVAIAAKKLAPETSLGTSIAAAALIDLVWPVFLLAGIEEVEIHPGDTAFTPLAFLSYPWSHSLLMTVVWGVAFGGFYYALRRYRRGAIVIGLLVVSHWMLDAISHRPDLPLTPWGDLRVGLGLWNSVAATLAVELAMFGAAVSIYVRATRARDRIGSWGFWGFVALVLGIYAAASLGPPPPDVAAIAYAGLGQWLAVALGAWIDHHRAFAPNLIGGR